MGRIAIVQQPPVFLDREATLASAVRHAAQAARDGAQLVVFPEAFVPGYPAWMWRLRPGPDLGLTEQIHARLLAASVDIGAGHLAALQEAAREHAITIVCGLHERDGRASGATLYNGVVVIGPGGELLNRHRKLMPTGAERMAWGFGDASGLRVVETPIGRLGVLICWENYMPQARLALYAEGIEVLVAPTYDSAKRGTLFAEVDIARVGSARRSLDVAGHYARPDLFTLHVDRRPQSAVTRQEAS